MADVSMTSDGSGGASPKSRPLIKLKKTPLELVISSDPSVMSQHQRPIGTPPPTSLRKSRGGGSDSLNSIDQQSALGTSSSFFPQISVDKCPEESPEEDQFAFPESSSSSEDMANRTDPFADGTAAAAASTSAATSTSPSASHDDGGGGGVGLTPPQRLVRRDSDGVGSGGVVFELSTAQGLQLAQVEVTGRKAESIEAAPERH